MMIPRRSEDWGDCKYDDTKEKRGLHLGIMQICMILEEKRGLLRYHANMHDTKEKRGLEYDCIL